MIASLLLNKAYLTTLLKTGWNVFEQECEEAFRKVCEIIASMKGDISQELQCCMEAEGMSCLREKIKNVQTNDR